MSESSEKQTHLPPEDAKIAPRGYYVALSFHPPIKLERKRALEYAATLADYVDPQNVSLDDQEWVFSQPISGSARSQFKVVIRPNRLQIHADFPKQAKEWFEDRQLTVMESFGERFSPKLILQSAAMIRGTLPIDGDARIFLARRVMNITEDPFRPLGRPIHVIGLRFVFPPFQVAGREGKEVTDWLVEVKAESLAEDPSQLYLEADARWAQPIPWCSESLTKVIEQQDDVSRYLETNVAGFLRQAARGEGGPNDSD